MIKFEAKFNKQHRQKPNLKELTEYFNSLKGTHFISLIKRVIRSNNKWRLLNSTHSMHFRNNRNLQENNKRALTICLTNSAKLLTQKHNPKTNKIYVKFSYNYYSIASEFIDICCSIDINYKFRPTIIKLSQVLESSAKAEYETDKIFNTILLDILKNNEKLICANFQKYHMNVNAECVQLFSEEGMSNANLQWMAQNTKNLHKALVLIITNKLANMYPSFNEYLINMQKEQIIIAKTIAKIKIRHFLSTDFLKNNSTIIPLERFKHKLLTHDHSSHCRCEVTLLENYSDYLLTLFHDVIHIDNLEFSFELNGKTITCRCHDTPIRRANDPRNYQTTIATDSFTLDVTILQQFIENERLLDKKITNDIVSNLVVKNFSAEENILQMTQPRQMTQINRLNQIHQLKQIPEPKENNQENFTPQMNMQKNNVNKKQKLIKKMEKYLKYLTKIANNKKELKKSKLLKARAYLFLAQIINFNKVSFRNLKTQKLKKKFSKQQVYQHAFTYYINSLTCANSLDKIFKKETNSIQEEIIQNVIAMYKEGQTAKNAYESLKEDYKSKLIAELEKALTDNIANNIIKKLLKEAKDLPFISSLTLNKKNLEYKKE